MNKTINNMETMAPQTDIERVVMRRVRLIRILQLVISTAVLAALTLTAALWGIGKEVWVARVFQNIPADVTLLPGFFLAAFTHTRLIVQVLVVFTFASFAYLVSELVRLAFSLFAPARA